MKQADIFLERSIRSALDFFKEAMFFENTAKSKGMLQSMDPRVKIILFMIMIVATCFIRSIPALLALYLVCLASAAISGINLPFYIKRVWVFVPIFTLFIAIPAVFTQGLYSASLFVIRVADCVSLAVLLAITTGHSKLIGSLRSIGIPTVFVQVLDMMYRYLFLFMKVFEDMHLSLKSRLIKKFDSSKARYWVASRIVFLFKRSARMSEEVYMAMLARGYTGENGKR